MREYVIQQLRELASVRGKQKTWISELTDEQLYELFLRFRNGQTAKAIARDIQRTWGVNPQSSVHSISQGILKFRRRISHLLLPSHMSDSSSPQDPLALEYIGQVEGAEGLERIAQLQLARIERMVNEELETGIKHNLSRELQALSGLTKTLMKAKEFEMVHKGNDPIHRRRLERMRRRFEKPFRALMDSIDEEGTSRLLEASSKLLEDLERHAVEAVVAPDGKLQLVKPDESPNDNHTQ